MEAALKNRAEYHKSSVDYSTVVQTQDVLDQCANTNFDYLHDDFYKWNFAIPNFFACGVKLRIDEDVKYYDD